MCGIFAMIDERTQAAQQHTLQGLKTLEYRGYDSWGVAWIGKEQKITVHKKVGKIGAALLEDDEKSTVAIGHTRWATHGGVTQQNAHPHLDCSGRFALVHNGIVENFEVVREKLQHQGHRFISETDTEVIVHLIESFAQQLRIKNISKEEIFPSAVRQAFSELQGMNSIVVLDAETQAIVAISHGSPLAYTKSEGVALFASDAVAFAPYASDAYFLQDREMVIIQKGRFPEKPMRALQFDEKSLEKNGYDTFMEKEIFEQPMVLTKVLQQTQAIDDFFTPLLTHPITFIACGTAYHASLWATYIFAELTETVTHAYIGSEMGFWQQFLTPEDRPVFVSQSGETIDLVETAMQLQSRGVPIHALVNRAGSTLDRLATRSHILPAGPEQCVMATKSFTAKVATFLLAAAREPSVRKQVVTDIEHARAALETILSTEYWKTYIEPVIRVLDATEHAFIIGRHKSYPIALEAVLKIKEVSYLHVEGFAGGELKHGVLALIEQGIPCIVIAPKDETYTDTISNAMEIKARGGNIIGISEENNATAFAQHLPVPNCGSATGIVQSVLMQLVACGLAKKKGNDVDKPRNLAKSVVVK